MATVPTVRIDDGAGGFVIINADDFNEAVHTPWREPKPKEKPPAAAPAAKSAAAPPKPTEPPPGAPPKVV